MPRRNTAHFLLVLSLVLLLSLPLLPPMSSSSSSSSSSPSSSSFSFSSSPSHHPVLHFRLPSLHILRPGSRDHRATPTREIRQIGESPRTRLNHSAPEVLPQNVLYVRRNNLRAGEENDNGSPNWGLIAEAVLQRLESPTTQTEILASVLTFKKRLNAVFPDIQFTMEEEENKQLAFLDVLVCRKDCGGLKTKVFRKATNTTQILQFNSN
nr:unnamed protein product [Spirometra erinaceieuropaei]